MSDHDPSAVAAQGAGVDPEEAAPVWNDASLMIALPIVFLVIKWICVLFRLHTRWRVTTSLGWDDLFVTVCLFTGTMGSIFVILMTVYGGLGRHFYTLSQEETMNYLKYFYVANASYILSTALIKISLLFQYMRIFSHSGIDDDDEDDERAGEKARKRQHLVGRVCRALILFVAVWASGYAVLAWVPCLPVWRFWVWAERVKCYGFASPRPDVFFATYASHAAVNMALDVTVLLIPVPLYCSFSTATTRTSTKAGLLCLHTVGAAICFLTVWRLASIVEHKAATWPRPDPTWYAPMSILLSTLEVDLGSICASIPVFWPVLSERLMSSISVISEVRVVSEPRRSSSAPAGAAASAAAVAAVAAVAAGKADHNLGSTGSGPAPLPSLAPSPRKKKSKLAASAGASGGSAPDDTIRRFPEVWQVEVTAAPRTAS